jgi:hypothetical protein
MSYLVGSGLCFVPWIFRVDSSVASLIAGLGPVALASLVSRMWGSTRTIVPVAMTNTGIFIHLAFGILFCSLPITLMVWLSLQAR